MFRAKTALSGDLMAMRPVPLFRPKECIPALQPPPAHYIIAEDMIEGVKTKDRSREDLPGTAPLVSIICVVFNACPVLPDLLDSVFAVKDQNVELILVDGGSRDGTLELLQRYGNKINYWLSEPDRGIYDAMNKAIARARGTFLLHLNAGDRLLRIPTEDLLLAEEEGLDIAAFRVSLDGKTEFRPRCNWELRFNNTLHHQGTFYRRMTFPSYDIRYKVFADFDVNQRLVQAGGRVNIFDSVVAFHATDGVSNASTPSLVGEFFNIIAKNHGRRSLPIAWAMCKWRGMMARLRR